MPLIPFETVQWPAPQCGKRQNSAQQVLLSDRDDRNAAPKGWVVFWYLPSYQEFVMVHWRRLLGDLHRGKPQAEANKNCHIKSLGHGKGAAGRNVWKQLTCSYTNMTFESARPVTQALIMDYQNHPAAREPLLPAWIILLPQKKSYWFWYWFLPPRWKGYTPPSPPVTVSRLLICTHRTHQPRYPAPAIGTALQYNWDCLWKLCALLFSHQKIHSALRFGVGFSWDCKE